MTPGAAGGADNPPPDVPTTRKCGRATARRRSGRSLQTRKALPPAVHAAVASGHPLYLDREQAGHIVDVHQMQHIEAMGFADHHFGRRERERQIAGGR